ncbi:MAG: chitobiase/beta-hexosaminidase C-terminal domain-containing protein [Ignavibacteriales bacterium]|nr:chitobiase/beta-hexosaminidase C-terminal domain-containing protein [Ignavibacteriales bacterium]
MLKSIWFTTILILPFLLIQNICIGQDKSVTSTNNVFTKIETPALFRYKDELNRIPTATLNPIFIGDFPDSAISAFRYADSIWSYLLISNQPIRIKVIWTDSLSANILAVTDSVSLIKNFPWAPKPDIFYPTALAEAITGSPLNHPDSTEMRIRFNKNKSWYFGTDGIPKANKYDFVSIALHEIAHGLGFSSTFSVDSTGSGMFGMKVDTLFYPKIFDIACVDQYSVSLVSQLNPSNFLGDKLKSNNVYFSGSTSYDVNNHSFPKLYAPSKWLSSSSIIHLDSTTFPVRNENSLMKYSFNMAEVIHSPGEVGLAILSDLGWPVNRIITPISPFGGEILRKGSTYNIRWSDSKGGGLILKLLRKGTDGNYFQIKNVCDTLINSNIGRNEYSWTVDTLVDDGDFKIKFLDETFGYGLSNTFTIITQVATPQFSPPEGQFDSSLYVKISCSTQGADIWYTLDGTMPDSSKYKYTDSIWVTFSKTIKARAYKIGSQQSNIAEAKYYIGQGIGTLDTTGPLSVNNSKGVVNSSRGINSTSCSVGNIYYYGEYAPVRCFLEWNLTNIVPIGAKIISARFETAASDYELPPTIKIYHVNVDFSKDTTLWSASNNGTLLENNVYLSWGFSKSYDSASTFVTKLEQSLLDQKFQLEFVSEQETYDGSYIAINASQTRLSIVYKLPIRTVTIKNNLDGAFTIDSIKVNGIQYPSPYTNSYPYDTELTIEATLKKLNYLSDNWKFRQWNDGSGQYSKNITIKDQYEYTANFDKVYNLTLKNDMEGIESGQLIYEGNTIPSGYTDFDVFINRSRTVNAITPQTYAGVTWNFYGWSDGVDSIARHITVTSTQEYKAKYKGHLISQTSSATKLSSQRKIVIEGDKKYAVYESGGMIFFIYDLGAGWSNEFRVGYSTSAKNPSITSDANYVYVVWDEGTPDDKHYVMMSKFFKNGIPVPFSCEPIMTGINTKSDDYVTPVVCDVLNGICPLGTFGPAIIWREKTDLYSELLLSIYNRFSNPHVYYRIATNAKQPSLIRFNDQYLVVYVNSAGQIEYQKFKINSIGEMTDQTTSILLSGSYTDCSNPSITTNSDGRIFVAWDGLNGSTRHVFVKECDASGTWLTTSEFTHGTHSLSSPSIGVDKQTLKVNVVFECGDHLARKSRLLSSSTWYTLCDMCQGYGPAVSFFEDDPYTPTYPTTYFTSGTSQPYSIISNVLGSIPATPIQSTPANEQQNVTINPTLIWNCTFDASTYHLQVSRTSDFSEDNLIVDRPTLTTTSYQLSNLAYSFTYYWRISAINESGESNPSPTWSFTTIPNPFPAPYLSGIRIADGTVYHPKLTWSTVSGAVSYVLYRYQCGSTDDCDDGIDQSYEIVYQGTALTYTDHSVATVAKAGNGSVWYIVRAKNSANALSARSNHKGFFVYYDIVDKNGTREGELPTKTKLEASYPNPFNPITTIRYQLAESGYITLAIYNELGQEVEKLAGGYQEAGYYERIWDAKNNPSGSYFIRLLITDENGKALYLKTEKIVVMK